MPAQISNLIGQRFGRLVVIEQAPSTKDKKARWLCRCDCGVVSIKRATGLKGGGSTSCGCYRKTLRVTHGQTWRREYWVWSEAKARCYNPSNKNYKHYGARGIRMCDKWRTDFQAFFDDMGPCPEGKSLDRYPNQNGNYEPGNCRWATITEQSRNRRSNVILEFNGERLCIGEWAERTGIKRATIAARFLDYGWSAHDALTIPVQKWGHINSMASISRP